MEIVVEQPSTWLDYAAALGTIGAVAVALYVGVVREWRRRPRLSLHFSELYPSDQIVAGVDVAGGATTSGAYMRLRVRNGPGKHAAEDVEVIVLEVRPLPEKERGGRPSFRRALALGDQNLVWSGSLPTATRFTIPPGLERHVDFVHVIRLTGSLPLRLSVHPEPVDRRNLIHHRGPLEVRLAVAARNADAHRYSVTVSFDGEWRDSIWEHLKIHSLRKLPDQSWRDRASQWPMVPGSKRRRKRDQLLSGDMPMTEA